MKGIIKTRVSSWVSLVEIGRRLSVNSLRLTMGFLDVLHYIGIFGTFFMVTLSLIRWYYIDWLD